MLLAVGTACGSNASAEPEREYTLRLRAVENGADYGYVADDPVDVRVGDRVTFEVRNDGALPHDLQILDPSGESIGVAPAVPSGETLQLSVTFDESGFYRLNCLVDDHLTVYGMQEIIEVADA